jgi:hypothetical protein
VIRELFQRKAPHEAELLAEAQALIDDGLDLEFVLGLFPDDAEWLEPMLDVTIGLDEAFEGEPASYYFEASLKMKFLEGAFEPTPVVPVIVAPPTYSPVRTAIATMSVAGTAAVMGVLALGFITADDSAPGDWNYAFKLANERFEYSTSRGDSRIDIQVAHVQARLSELQQMSDRGAASPSQIERVQREFDELARLARTKNLDAVDKAQVESAGKAAAAVLSTAVEKQPELAVPAAAAAAAIGDTVVTAIGPPPTATATASPTAEPTPTPEETPVPPSPSPSPSPTESPTPAATETPTPEATATSTTLPSEEATATPEASATPTP